MIVKYNIILFKNININNFNFVLIGYFLNKNLKYPLGNANITL